MNFIQTTIATLGLALLLGIFLPWWSIAIAAFLMAVLTANFSRFHFASGFLGISLAWLIQFIVLNMKNDGIMLNKVAQVFSENLGRDLPGTIIILLACLIGGLIGGFSALTGSLLPTSFSTKTNRRSSSKGQYKINIQ